MTLESIFKTTVETAVLIVGIGIVGTDLGIVPTQLVETRSPGIVVLDEFLERETNESTEVAIALRAVEGVGRRLLPEERSARALETLTELVPRAPIEDPLDRIDLGAFITHSGTSSSRIRLEARSLPSYDPI